MGFRSCAKILPAYVLCLPLFSASQTFISQGPAPDTAPSTFGPGITFSGAIQAIAPSPLDPNTIYIGGTNGGVWRSANFGQSWTAQMQNQTSLSISSLVFDPADASGSTLLAGIGIISNGSVYPGFRGGPSAGVLYTTNGGNTWTNPGSGTISALNVDSVFVNGSFMLAGEFTPQNVATGVGSLYKSTNTGATFAAISVSGNIGTEPVTAIATPPGDPNTIYVAITRTGPNTADTALYQTVNQGASFTPLFTAADSAGLINGTDQTVLKVATGPSGSIAVGIVNTADTTLGSTNDRLVGIFLSTNAGATWTQLDLSDVNAVCDGGNCGFNPEGQGVINSALAIDPTNPSVVYAAGTSNGGADQLDVWKLELSGISTIATNISVGANGSNIHPDVRTLIFSGPNQPPASRRLLIADDGGLDSRTTTGPDGIYLSLNGTPNTPTALSLYEAYSAGYDGNNNRVILAAQDNGFTIQNGPGATLFTSQGGADGTNAVVNDKTSNTISYYYFSNQELGGLNRVALPVGGTPSPAVELTFSGDPITPFFGSPVELNFLDPTKIALGGTADVLITQDNLTGSDLALTSRGSAIGAGVDASFLSYGTMNNPDALIAGTASSTVFFTSDASTTDLAATSYAGGKVAGAVFDRRDSDRFFISDGATLWYTSDSGASFADQSGNFPAGFIRPLGVEFISNIGVNSLLIGGMSTGGANPLIAVDSDGAGVLSNWRQFGIGLPNAMVNILEYNTKADVLLASEFGRGTWLMYDATSNFATATVLQFGFANNDSTPDASVLTDGTVIGGRGLVKQGTGTLTISTPVTYTGTTTVLNGRLVDNGSIPGPVVVSGPTSVLTGTGSAGATTITNGATLQPGNGLGNFTVASLDLGPGNNLQVQFSPTQISTLTVAGNATLGGNLLLTQNPGNYPAEGTLPFLFAGGTISGSLVPVPVSVLPGFSFNIVQGANNLALHWLRSMVLNGITGNAQKFGNYINTFGPNSQAEKLLAGLSGNTLKNALESAMPVRNCIPVYIADNNVFLFRALTTHFSEVHYQRLFDCCEHDPCCDENQAIWIDGFANIASQDEQSQVPEFHFNTEGVVLGYDNFCSDCWTWGIAAGYAYDHFHEDHHRGSGHINTVFVAPYSTLYFCDFFADIELLYAYNWVENRRHISFPGFRGDAKSHYHINQFMPHLGIGYDYCCCDFILEPFASFDWVINWQDDFTEHGAAPFNVREKSHHSSMLRSELGLRAYKAWEICWGDLYLRAVGGYVNRTFFHIGKETSTLIGFPTSLTLKAFKHDQNLGTWGIAMMLKTECGYFGMLSYDGEAGDGYLSNQIQLKVGMEF